MVGIVIVSHSCKICDGIYDVVKQMAPNCKLAKAGGLQDGQIGTDIEKILDAIESVISDDGVLVLVDLGSAIMSTEMAIEMCSNPNLVEIVDAPIVESSIIAAVSSSLNKTKKEILEEIKEAKNSSKII